MAKLKHLELPDGSNYDIYGVNVQEISYDDYQALTPTQKNSDIAYCITDTQYEVDDSIYGEASGTIASFNNGSANPLKNLEVDINPIQDLHGYDKPWAGGSGKNKCIDKDWVQGQIQSDGSITYVGYSISSPFILLTAGKNYTLSRNYIDYGVGQMAYHTYNTNKEHISDSGWITNNYTINPSNDCYIRLTTRARSISDNPPPLTPTEVGTSLLVQLEEGTTATTYEPYSNICPISGRSNINTTVVENNLTRHASIGVVLNTDGTVSMYAPYSCTDFCEVDVNSTYKTSITVNYHTNWDWRIASYDENKQFIELSLSKTLENGYYEEEVVFPANTKYIRACALNPIYSTGWKLYSLDDTNITTIPLGQIVYGGKLNVTTGELTVDRAMVDLGDLTWSYTNGRFYNKRDDIATYGQGEVADILCDTYATSKYTSQVDSTIASWNGYIYVRDDSFSGNPTNFKQAMDGHECVYKLATPTTISLTPTQVSSLLGNNNIWADSGDVDVVYITSDFIYNELRMNDTVIASNSFAYHSIESESATMAGHANTASNARTVNGHTVNSDVPSNATFTDTTYTFANGTNGFTVTPSGGTAQTITVTPSITNNVTGSGTSGYLAKFNGANTVTNGVQLGSDTTKFLRNDGTWVVPPGSGSWVEVDHKGGTTPIPIPSGITEICCVVTIGNNTIAWTFTLPHAALSTTSWRYTNAYTSVSDGYIAVNVSTAQVSLNAVYNGKSNVTNSSILYLYAR